MFKCFGVVFHKKGIWNHMIQSTVRSSNAIKHFFYMGGEQLVPIALKYVEAKKPRQILYGAQARFFFLKKESLETKQTKFLRSIFAAPNRISNAQLKIETGMPNSGKGLVENSILPRGLDPFSPDRQRPLFL